MNNFGLPFDKLRGSYFMKKNTFLRSICIALYLISFTSYSQNLKPFTPRYNADVKGDILLIGNNILNKNIAPDSPNVPYNATGMNSTFAMGYIDIDSDATTFSSSNAVLDIPNSTCYKIKYAGLYWSAILQSGSRTDINKVKLQLPSGGYNDITGEVIYDADTTPLGTDNNKPYTCYADVTTLVAGLTDSEGTYTVANVMSSQGANGTSGLSAGWTLFIVYEDIYLPTKHITSFDGFSAINTPSFLDIPISGFTTTPFGPVRAKFAMAALEGDSVLTGDYLRINGNTLSSTERAATNFFNSTITTPTGYFTTRAPNSSNTLGLDATVMTINNPANSVLGNNATSATIRLGDASDHFYYFFNALTVDVIAPKIVLETIAKDNADIPIEGSTVNLDQQVNYAIGFQNIGNDNVTSFTIKEVIPINLAFNPADLSAPGTLPAGVTFTYDSSTRTIVFTIPNSLVEVGDPRLEIVLKTTIATSCIDFKNACANLIQNQTFATYSGTINPSVYSNEGSIVSYGTCLLTAIQEASKFQVNLSSCDFTHTLLLIGPSLNLTAASGYQNYIWSGPGPIIPVNGTNNQSVTIIQAGVYTVNDNTNSPSCVSFTETFYVNIPGVALPLIVQEGDKLKATTNNATYQWIDCDSGNASISGETNQYFEPTASGNYAVIISNNNGNQAVSSCFAFTFLNETGFEKLQIKLYPNPVNDKLFIAGDIAIQELRIYNLLGQQIMYSKGDAKEYSISQLEPGTYLVKIQTEKGTVNSKIIKQ